MITATDLLDFLTKAQKLSIRDVTFCQTDEGYSVVMRHDWYDSGELDKHGVFITYEGESRWDWDNVFKGVQYFEFDTMNRILDEMLVAQTEKEIKTRKRKELIESLTPEQRELLGV